jgi:adenylate cyclase
MGPADTTTGDGRAAAPTDAVGGRGLAAAQPIGRINLAHEAPLKMGALTIDPGLRQVANEDGREEIVEPRVMQVLVALIHARGGILSRDDLLMSCWYGVVVGEDAINRVMGRVRRLADGIGDGAFKLETITKVGYRLVSALGSETRRPPADAPTTPRGPTICVLPFVNMSGDPEQEYFSDGISEDIITDLSKVAALQVCARNTAFTFKGKSVRAPDLARELSVSHVLEGSVRRAGGRVRITAQLIDGATGNHVWADRYDRDLTDIFALQDEISEAIVSALRLKLLPAEKSAIERRGTSNPDAYEIYLMGRQMWLSGHGSVRGQEAILRLARRATEIDPDYAQAWAMMASAQAALRRRHGRADLDGVAAAERALALDPTLAAPHAIKARLLAEDGRTDEAEVELETALRLDPAGFEANETAGYRRFGQGRFEDAIGPYELAASVPEAPIGVLAMLLACYTAIGDKTGEARAARMTLERAQAELAKDPNNTDAIAYGADAHAALGDADSARAWGRRAMLIDPDNRSARYNLACGLAGLDDRDPVLDLLAPYLATATIHEIAHIRVDPGLDPLRDDHRFVAMLAEADARLGRGSKSA